MKTTSENTTSAPMRADRPFVLRVAVTDRLLRDGGDQVRGAIRETLLSQARYLRGPRGGRYAAVGSPFAFWEGRTDDDFIRNRRTFTARVMGRYVRPERK